MIKPSSCPCFKTSNSRDLRVSDGAAHVNARHGFAVVKNRATPKRRNLVIHPKPSKVIDRRFLESHWP